MKNTVKVAVLGFGVVGGGVVDLLTNNNTQLSSLCGKEFEVKYILDKRDFPDSPFASLITHNYDDILADETVEVVVEAMGGSHPAYEFTISALKSGKSVVTSNKEVVAKYADEFLAAARRASEKYQRPVSYLFEASVGGGIPIIHPILNCVRHNKISEIRGILNGTTNYILTKMFTYGDNFTDALASAQKKGYAERNPDADILGFDACRKIAILTSLVCGEMIDVDNIPTEGITVIRANDVKFAEYISHSIKLVARCVIDEERGPVVTVSPYLLPSHLPLSSVNGVYNAVEVIGEPIGNVMFYGKGAGAGATASAVVSDIVSASVGGTSLMPVIKKSTYCPKEYYKSSITRMYLALPKDDEERAKEVFGDGDIRIYGDECIVITPNLCESEIEKRISEGGFTPLSKIRFL